MSVQGHCLADHAITSQQIAIIVIVDAIGRIGNTAAGQQARQWFALLEFHGINLSNVTASGQCRESIVTRVAAGSVRAGGGVILVNPRGELTVAVSVEVQVDANAVEALFTIEGLVQAIVIGIQPHPVAEAGAAGRQDDPRIPRCVVLACGQGERCRASSGGVGIGASLCSAICRVQRRECRAGRQRKF